MSWKFWDKKEPNESDKFVVDTEVLPLSTLFRWFCYDTGVSNTNEFAEAFGLNPISQEGEDMELSESADRLEQVIPYLSFLNVMSDINAMILVKTMNDVLLKKGLVDEESLEKSHEDLLEIYTTITLGALVGSFSSALALGIVVNPGSFTSEAEDEF